MKRVLIVAPHPDDEVLGCGGAIAHHVAAGDEVHVLVVTRGVEEIFPEELILRTRRELESAHRILGVASAAFLDFPAPRLDTVPLHRIADGLSSHLERLRPQVLYIPHSGDVHVDHKATFWAALVAARPGKTFAPGRVLCYETPSETEWGAPLQADAFVPTVYLDITDTLEKKLAAMASYQTQLKSPPNARSLRTVEALAVYRGATINSAAAEAFMLVREILR